MFALYDSERATLLRVAAMLIIGASAILPLTLPTSSVSASAGSIVHASGNIALPAIPGRMEYPEISISRDPFVADPGVLARSISALQTGSAGNMRPAFLPIVRAIISGDRPRALIEVNGNVRVFSVGDQIAGESVASIDQDGIQLSSGVRIGIVRP